MSILVDRNTRLIMQGMSGKQGRFHAAQMIEYGTTLLGGVTPGKGGEWVHGLPIFDTVSAALNATEANTSLISVPPHGAIDAIYEAIDAQIELIVCITEGIPIQDMMRIYTYAQTHQTRLIGPNCAGIATPDEALVGIIPGNIMQPGHVGVVSKSGALTYEVIYAMTQANIGQSTIVGIGGDPIIGTNFVEILEMFENDPETEKVVLLGEIGGRAEIAASDYIKLHMTKPVFAYVAGETAPEDIHMGHTGAVIENGRGTALEKIKALQDAGVRVTNNPEQIPRLLTQ